MPDTLWDIKSDSSDTKYRVTEKEDGSWTCTCKSFEFRKVECKHIRTVKANGAFVATKVSAEPEKPEKPKHLKGVKTTLQFRGGLSVKKGPDDSLYYYHDIAGKPVFCMSQAEMGKLCAWFYLLNGIPVKEAKL